MRRQKSQITIAFRLGPLIYLAIGPRELPVAGSATGPQFATIAERKRE